MDTTILAALQGQIRNRLATRAMSVVLGFSLLGLAAGSTYAQTGPPGNNGTVKIHDGGTEPSPEVRNQPHVCTFHLHFFFADAGQAGAWWIRAWSPTGSGATVLTGNYLTDANGEFRTPAEPGAYTLRDGHYKLFWEGRASTEIKHKVFWVKCAATSGASGGAGSTENGAAGGSAEAASVMPQLTAAFRIDVSAEKAELAAVAGVQASMKAQLAAEETLGATSLSAAIRTSLEAQMTAQKAELSALAELAAAIQARIEAGQAVLAASTTAQLKAAVRAEVSAEKPELAAVAGVQASIKTQLAASARTLTVLGAESAGAPTGNAGNSPAGGAGGAGGTGGTNGSGSAGAGAAANAAVGGAVAGVTVTPPPTDATTQTSQRGGSPLLPLILAVLVAVGLTVVGLTRFSLMRRTMR